MDLSNIKFPSPNPSSSYFWTVGADPEVFLQVGPRDILEPTKEIIGDHAGHLAPDGAQLEFHPKPSCCRGAFIDTLRECLLASSKVASTYKATLAITPAIPLSLKCLKKLTPAAQQFGCDPDWSAYTLQTNQNAMDASRHPLRYGGGHIHVETSSKDYIPAYALMADLVAGIPAAAMTPDVKASRARRKRFGRAGCFRQQPHGWEYRTLDNFWLLHPKLAYLFTGLVRDATSLVKTYPEKCKKLLEEHGDIIRDIINEVDVEAAKNLWGEVAPELEKLMPSGLSPSTTPSGSGELHMASQLLGHYTVRVEPELTAKTLTQLWRLDVTGQTGFRQANYYMQHGGFCRGGFEEFVNPRLSRMYDWLTEHPTQSYPDYYE